jgi:hypothetical protein
MYIRRAGRKPVATPTARENNIAGNVKNGIERTGTISKPTILTRKLKLFKKHYRMSHPLQITGIPSFCPMKSSSMNMVQNIWSYSDI